MSSANTLLSCVNCSLNFVTNIDAFMTHFRSSIHANDSIHCIECNRRFTSGTAFVEHYQHEHVMCQCPMCTFMATNVQSVQQHFDECHNFADADNVIDSNQCCPVCQLTFADVDTLTDHVNSAHFVDDNNVAVIDENLSYSRPSTSRNQINTITPTDMEDYRWPVRDFIDRVRILCAASADVQETRTCTAVDFYATANGDRGFGCGYRNIQMLLSSMFVRDEYRQCFGIINNRHRCITTNVPSIRRLQQLIERAWTLGFDLFGADQLAHRLVGTRKWIGATEVATLLHSHRIRYVFKGNIPTFFHSTQLVDFHTSTGPANSHPAMFDWIWSYFEHSSHQFTAPLYIQHDGHSRTVIGIERTITNGLRLLILDPSVGRARLAAIADSAGDNSFDFLRQSLAQMRKRQFQIVAVRGMMCDTDDNEYERAKSFQCSHLRIPP